MDILSVAGPRVHVDGICARSPPPGARQYPGEGACEVRRGAGHDNQESRVHDFALVSSLAGCVLSLSILLSGEPLHVEIQQSLPFGTMAFHADRLSAFFLGVISLIAAAVSFYSLGYATEFIQEVITLLVFGVFSIFYLREELKWNYLLAFS